MLVDSDALVEELRVHLQKLHEFTQEWHYQQDYLLCSLGKARTSELGHGGWNTSTLASLQNAPTSTEVRGLSQCVSSNDIQVHVDEDRTFSRQEVVLNGHDETSPIKGSSFEVDKSMSSISFEEHADQHEYEVKSDEGSIHDSISETKSWAPDGRRKKISVKDLKHAKVSDQVFETLVVCVIVANTFVIALESDISIKSPNEEPPSYLKYCEASFIILYTIEIGIRIWAKGCSYFKQKDERALNVFDFVLAVHGLVEQAISLVLAQGESALSNLSFLRFCRLMKVLKVLRVACTEYLRDVGNVDEDVEGAIKYWWGSVPTSMLSLFMAVMGGQDWVEIAEPLKSVSGWVYGLFVFYIAVFSFVVINIVSSIFFEAMIYHAEKDEELVMLNHLEREEEYITKFEKMYHELDHRHDGGVIYQSFCSSLDSPKMLEFLTMLDLDAMDAKHIFSVLSDKGKQSVGPEAFVSGCIKLKGTAKSVDLIDLLNSLKSQQQEQLRMSRELHCMVIDGQSGQKAHDRVAQRALHDLKELLQESKCLSSRAARGLVVSPPEKLTALQL